MYLVKASDVDNYEHKPRGKPSAEAARSNNSATRPAGTRRAKQAKAASRK
jgi:hypothetical protein